MGRVRASVQPLPPWLDAQRLVGAGVRVALEENRDRLELSLEASQAADLAARLRGLGIDGRALEVRIDPPLSRSEVRAARLREARARRQTTPGFTRAGARASGEGRFSLTPEVLALRLGELARGQHVIDACCGSGGNAVGFARAGCRVTAIELDADRLDEARHNAALYGVRDRIRFLHGDACELVAREPGTLLFVDPPWGEHYDKRHTRLADFPLLSALLAQRPGAPRELWAKLPSSFELASLPGASASAWFGEAPGDRHRIKFVLLRRPL